MPTNGQMATGLGIIVGGCVLAVVGVTFGITKAFQYASNSKEAFAKVQLSEARKALIIENVAGSPAEFQGYLKQKTDEYFAAKGFPVDPGKASNTVGETANKARGTVPQPK